MTIINAAICIWRLSSRRISSETGHYRWFWVYLLFAQLSISVPLCNRIFTAIMPMVAAGLIPDDPTLQPIRRLISLVRPFLVVHLCVLCCFNTFILPACDGAAWPPHLTPLIRATDRKEHILIGWLWGYLCDQSAGGSLESASQNQTPAHSSNTRAAL